MSVLQYVKERKRKTKCMGEVKVIDREALKKELKIDDRPATEGVA